MPKRTPQFAVGDRVFVKVDRGLPARGAVTAIDADGDLVVAFTDGPKVVIKSSAATPAEPMVVPDLRVTRWVQTHDFMGAPEGQEVAFDLTIRGGTIEGTLTLALSKVRAILEAMDAARVVLPQVKAPLQAALHWPVDLGVGDDYDLAADDEVLEWLAYACGRKTWDDGDIWEY